MARTTTNYGWNISEGSDLVNPLTDIFPNFESLDTDLKGVSDSAIGTATELKTGTVHALTRDDTSRDVFKFTATSNFTAGDTFTVDSEQVSALTTSGEQLTTGCYIIGSEVLVAKKGTLLTFYISNVITDASTLEGHSASYFATASDLNSTDADVLTLSNKVGSAILTTEAQDCSSAINELNTDLSVIGKDITNTSVSGTTITLPNEGNVYRISATSGITALRVVGTYRKGESFLSLSAISLPANDSYSSLISNALYSANNNVLSLKSCGFSRLSSINNVAGDTISDINVTIIG